MGKIVLKDGTIYDFYRAKNVDVKKEYIYLDIQYFPRKRFYHVSIKREMLKSMDLSEKKIKMKIIYKEFIKVGDDTFLLVKDKPTTKDKAINNAVKLRKVGYKARVIKCKYGEYGEITRFLVYIKERTDHAILRELNKKNQTERMLKEKIGKKEKVHSTLSILENRKLVKKTDLVYEITLKGRKILLKEREFKRSF